MRFGNELDAGAVVTFLSGVATGLPQTFDIAIEVIATKDRYEHRLRLPVDRAGALLAQLRAAIPQLRVEAVDPKIFEITAGFELQLVGGDASLRSDSPETASASMLAALQPLASTEAAVLQWVIRPGGLGSGEPSWRTLIDRQMRQLVGTPPRPVDPKVAEAKAELPQLDCVLRIGAKAGRDDRAWTLVHQVVATLGNVRTATTFLTTRRVAPSRLAGRMSAATAPARFTSLRLTAPELAGVLGWPIGAPHLPGLSLGTSRHLSPGAAIANSGIVIGTATMPGAEREVALTPELVCQHLAITSPTGTGKSTVLGTIALQAIRRRMGTIVIDWKGDLVADVLDRLEPSDAERVIVIDPTTPNAVVGLPNPLAAPPLQRDRLVDQLVGILQRSWDASWGPRTGAVVQAALFTLARSEGSSLIDLPELLVNKPFRRQVLEHVSDTTGLAGFWTNFEAMSDPERAQVIAPTLNRTRPWLLRQDIRHLLGQPTNTWSFDEVLDGKVLLVSLASGALGDETAALVGALIIGELTAAIRRRSKQPQQRRRKALVVLDEFHNILGLPFGFASTLVEARGLGVGFVLAHQHLAQLGADLREAVLANVRSRLAFQLGASDATVMARELRVDAADLQHLPAFEAIGRLATSAGISAPVSLRTSPLPAPVGKTKEILRESQRRYAVSRAGIDSMLAARYQPDSSPQDEPAVGLKRRTQ